MARPGIGAEVEGVHAVAAAVAAGRVERIVVERQRRDDLAGLVEDAGAAGAEVAVVDDVASIASTAAPQGVVARCRPIPDIALADAVERLIPAALVVLDHLEDPRNVGAIARSAAAAGFSGLVTSTRRAAPLGATAFKAAAGALELLDLVLVSSIPDAIEQLRRLGVWSVGLDSGGSTNLFGLELLSAPVAIVVGAEGEGLSRLARERCDVVASIPIDQRVESLNASAAATLAVFEVARARASIDE